MYTKRSITNLDKKKNNNKINNKKPNTLMSLGEYGVSVTTCKMLS